jgi:hypothetical protein
MIKDIKPKVFLFSQVNIQDLTDKDFLLNKNS